MHSATLSVELHTYMIWVKTHLESSSNIKFTQSFSNPFIRQNDGFDEKLYSTF